MRGATAESTCDACGPPDDGSMGPRVPALAQRLGVYDLREAARSMGDGVAGVRGWQRDLVGGHEILQSCANDGKIFSKE